MLRDPRDVARSSIGMGWAGDVYHGAEHWMKTEAEYHDAIHRLPKQNVLEMTYEQLIEAPEATLRNISSFCGVDYTADMLNYDRNSSYGKPDIGLTYQWKRKQSAYEVGLVEGRIGDMLERSGYEPSGHPVINLQGMALRKLRWQNRLTRLRGRINRYGVKDTGLVAIAHRLGKPSLARAAQRRIDDIEITYLK